MQSYFGMKSICFTSSSDAILHPGKKTLNCGSQSGKLSEGQAS